MKTDDRPKPFDTAYPEPMREAEDRLLAMRRRALDAPDRGAGRVGFALSGGGIRSATFCLGLFQGLAKRGGLLRKIDYLSTVSGGGYFGGFLGRLARRDAIATPDDLEAVLTEDRGRASGDEAKRLTGAVRYLRENGRYLSPNGSGDLLLGGAVLFRNWLSIQAVLASFVLMVFLLFQAVRVAGEVAAHRLGDGTLSWLFVGEGSVALSLWWSPLWSLALAVFVLGALPLGWSYWLVGDVSRRMVDTLESPAGRHRGRRWLRFVPVPIVAVAALAYLGWLLHDSTWGAIVRTETCWLAASLLVIPLLAVLYWSLAQRASGRAGDDTPDEDTEIDEVIFEDAAVRHRLSLRVRTALMTTAALVAVALLDSVGQTLYVHAVEETLSVAGWVGSILAGLTALSGLARRLVVRFATGSGEARLSLPSHLLATAAAIAVAAFLLVIADAASHAVAWAVRVPPDVVRALAPEAEGAGSDAAPALGGPGVTAERSVVGAAAALDEPSRAHVRDSVRDLLPALLGILFLGALSLAVSRIWSFVNRSSHHPLYTARLVRAYLGASNPDRLGPHGESVTEVLRGDDLNLESYWPPPAGNGFPLHLINATVNETVDGRSQVQQQDRKGTGLALGPAGLSLGIRHHVVGPFGQEERPPRVHVFPEGSGEFRAFEYPEATGEGDAPGALRSYRGEPLTLGAWIGISGAAFTTGLGFRTSLGLALLAGLANVRLGYWWDSGVDPDERVGAEAREPRGLTGRFLAGLAHLFPVQSLLTDELFARFPGTARGHWYLSDGGFFENLGGYELVRRRLPLMVVVDSTADPDYELGALANLVRKARLDFGAEITFLPEEEIATELPPATARYVGSLAQLRRGRWRAGEEKELREADRAGHSLVHAALARVRYADDGTECRLLYIKPTLLPDAPEDVLDYHRRHPAFPQETTGDQFFDEAQWESYRRLGEHIALRVFRGTLEAEEERLEAHRAAEASDDPARRPEAIWHPGRLETPPPG